MMENNYTNGEKERMAEQALNDIVDELDQEHLPTANIVVAGITGTGKSTLLNAVFGDDLAATGKGRPVTEHIDEYESLNIPIHIWDTVGLELDSAKTKESINSIKQIIANKAGITNWFDHVHAIWYCINSGSSRYQGAELEFIKSLHSVGVPFIIVLTQCIGDEEEINAFEDEIRKINAEMGMSDIDIVQVCAKEFKTRRYTIPAFGLEDLVDKTIKKLPNFIKSGFAAAQKVSKFQKRLQCEEIIYSYIQKAKEGFWDKVPIVNIFQANSKILEMLQKIGEMYNTQIPREGIVNIINKNHLNWDNIFHGLLNPLNKDYYKKVMTLLSLEKFDGFEVNIEDLRKNERVAVMVTFYGYTFVSAIEELWEGLTEEQLKDVEMVCSELIRYINEILKNPNRANRNARR